jgi:hypothetical protein
MSHYWLLLTVSKHSVMRGGYCTVACRFVGVVIYTCRVYIYIHITCSLIKYMNMYICILCLCINSSNMYMPFYIQGIMIPDEHMVQKGVLQPPGRLE